MIIDRLWDKFWHKTLKRPYRLHVSDIGKGEPLVLLHGLAQSGSKWAPLAERLDKSKWRVILPDLLGFGRSPKPQWNKYTVQEHARAIVTELTRRNLKKQPVTIVGHSMGCLVAVHVAVARPDLVKRLVLFEPPLFADDPIYRKHNRRRSRYFRFYKYFADHPQLAFFERQIVWRVVRRLSGLRLSREEWVPFEQSIRNTIMKQTAYNELCDIGVPTDIIHGRLDVIVTRSQIKEMFADNNHIKLHITNDMHDISPRAAKYIMRLLESVPLTKLDSDL